MQPYEIEVILGSPPEKELAAIQLFIKDGEQWGEVDQESGRLEIEIFSREDGKPWRFRLADLEKVIRTAKDHLACS